MRFFFVGYFIFNAGLLSTVVSSLHSSLSTLDHIPVRGGLPLNDVVMGRSERKDFRGNSYIFFVLQPQIDVHVSGSMLNNGGIWESSLNALFDAVVSEAKVKPEDKNVAVVDVGANVGAFSLYVASLGFRLYSFEMQEKIYTLLETSRRVNNYHSMKLFHAALWNETGKEITFTPVIGNFGGTSIIHPGEGTSKMTTTRLIELLPRRDFFFLKIDVENAEAYVLQGISELLETGAVKNLVMETRKNQADIVDWFYSLGYICGNYDRKFWTRVIAGQTVSQMSGEYMDIYCKFVGGVAAQRHLLGVNRQALIGVYTPKHGWR